MISEHRFALRERTSHKHRTLDAEIGSLDTVENYRRYLSGMLDFRMSIEPHLSGRVFPAGFGSWMPTLIGEDLARDIRDCGCAARVPGAPVDESVFSNVSALLGLLYVLEGSALGARILKQQAAALGYHGDFGARHLARQVGEPQSWSRFISILDSEPLFDRDVAGRAAEATFDIAHRSFRKERHAEAAG